MAALSDEALRAKTAEFKARVANGETLDAILPEAFAVVREAGKRVLQHAPLRRAADRRHGAAPRQDRRDAHRRGQDAGRHAAGLPQRAGRQGRARRHGQRLPRAARRRLDGAHLPLPRPHRRREPVADGRTTRSRPPTPPTSPTAPTTSSASTTCATTWCSQAAERVQRGLNYAIVDEVDSILIDEARTPLIISGQAEDNIDLYYRLNEVRAAARRARPRRRGRATTGSTRRRTRCCCPRPATSTPRRCSPRSACSRRGTSLYDAAQHRADAPPVRGAARARRCSTATSTTWCRTARSIIVDEFTGRLMPAGAGPTACTRRSRPRRACRSRARTRRSPRSPSRTTSACTASSPA